MTNPPPMKLYTYMTYIPHRSPQWKHHTNIGHVKNAIQQKMYGWSSARKTSGNMQVYQWLNDDWEILWDIPKGTPYSELPWVNTPEVKAKQEVETRKNQLYKLQNIFVTKRDSAKLQQVWDATPNKPLEEQFDFSVEEYL